MLADDPFRVDLRGDSARTVPFVDVRPYRKVRQLPALSRWNGTPICPQPLPEPLSSPIIGLSQRTRIQEVAEGVLRPPPLPPPQQGMRRHVSMQERWSTQARYVRRNRRAGIQRAPRSRRTEGIGKPDCRQQRVLSGALTPARTKRRPDQVEVGAREHGIRQFGPRRADVVEVLVPAVGDGIERVLLREVDEVFAMTVCFTV